jgi:hypothetical protein
VTVAFAAAGVPAQAAQPGAQKTDSSGKADIVEVVGCLSAGPGGTWTVTHATTPVVSTVPFTTENALKDDAAKPLGTATFTLIGLKPFNPDANKDHKVAVKGLRIKDTAGDRLNVTSLQTVAAACQ